MPRRKRCRNIEKLPEYELFGVLKKQHEDEEKTCIILTIDELEAVRLKDLEKLDQEQCASKMDISRQTFQLIISSAREKISRMLVEGKNLNITGGHYKLNSCVMECDDCYSVYNLNYEGDKKNCPECNSKSIKCIKKRKGCNKWCEK